MVPISDDRGAPGCDQRTRTDAVTAIQSEYSLWWRQPEEEAPKVEAALAELAEHFDVHGHNV
jgi:hypothetical protein